MILGSTIQISISWLGKNKSSLSRPSHSPGRGCHNHPELYHQLDECLEHFHCQYRDRDINTSTFLAAVRHVLIWYIISECSTMLHQIRYCEQLDFIFFTHAYFKSTCTHMQYFLAIVEFYPCPYFTLCVCMLYVCFKRLLLTV